MEEAFVNLICHLQELKRDVEKSDDDDLKEVYYSAQDVVESWTKYQEECKKSLTVTRQSLPASDPQQQP